MINFATDPYTHVYALVGNRIQDSWLTVIHNTLFAAGQHNAICVPLPSSGERALDVFSLLGDGLDGIFVTGNMMGLASSWAELADADSRALKLADLLSVDSNGQTYAHNTMADAVISSLRESWIDVKDDRALVIGGGHMARICAYALTKEGAEVLVSARNRDAAIELQSTVESATGHEIQTCSPGKEYGEFALVVNATPFGCASTSHRDMGQPSPISDELLERCGAVLECVPTPVETELISRAESRSLNKAVRALDVQLNSALKAQSLLGFRQLQRKVGKAVISELKNALRDAR